MSDLSQLTPDQRALVELLLREQGQDPDLVLPLPRRPEPATAPLSSAQERMWFAHQLAPAEGTYNIQTALRLSGALDVPRLQQAVDRLVARHETLRTSFAKDGENPYQRIHPAMTVPLARVAFGSRAELLAFVEAEALRPWDLAAAPSLRATLIQCSEREHVLLLGMHHILSDGWSVGILVRELWALYDGKSPLVPLAVHYADYAAWERRRPAGRADAHLAFWRTQLRDAWDYLPLPLDHPRPPGGARRGALRAFSLPADLAQSVRTCARQLPASPFAVCLASFQLLLSELTGATDLLVGTPVANRERAELEPLIGYFANSVVLRSEWSPHASFRELVQQIRDRSLAALEHQSLPFEKVVENFKPRRVPGANPLFQVFFAFQQYGLGGLRAEGLEIAEFDYTSRATRFDCELHVWETRDGGLDAVFVYAADLFEATTLARWEQRWLELLARACAAPEAPLTGWSETASLRRPPAIASIETARASLESAAAALDSVTQAVALVHESPAPPLARLAWSELYPSPEPAAASPAPAPAVTAEPAPLPPRSPHPAISHGAPLALDPAGPATLGDLLARAAAEHPASGCRFLPADTFLSYPALLADARRVQTWLEASGIAVGTVVLLQLTEEQDILTCFWGAVLAGAVPFILPIPDAYHPEAESRLTATWRHLDCPPIVANRSAAPAWTQPARVLPWDRTVWGGAAPAARPHRAQPDDLAFFSQSSGTTGQPKCVPLRHRNVLARAFAALAFTGVDASRVFLNWLPLDHIGSLSDWHLRCVAAGGNPIYGQKGPVLARPTVWLDWIERYHVTDTWAPNFAYNLLLEALPTAGRRWDLSRLRTCLTAAEGIASATLDRLEDALADSGFTPGIFQPAFGMAEVVSGITYHRPTLGARVPRRSPRGDARVIVDCGAPIPGVSLRIVDEAGEVVREEERGHFQIKGAPLFSGYHRLPEHNAERFTADRWFDTGDFGFLFEGHLFVTGREAGEIVVNGRKFPCEEIERAVASVDGVRAETAVVCSVRPQGDPQLAVFFSPQGDAPAAEIARKIRGLVGRQFGLRVDHLVPLEPREIVRTSIGKLQRSVLARQFDAGRFQPLPAAAPPAVTVPSAFFVPGWKRSPLPPALPPGQTIHLIADAGTLATAVARSLRTAGHQVEIVARLPALGTQRSWHLVDLSLHRPPDVASDDLSRALATANHLRTLLQELQRDPPAECRLSVVTCQARATGREDNVQCADAVVTGLLKTAAQEFSPWFRGRHIDVAASADDDPAELLAAEIAAEVADPEVAYRDRHRLVPTLLPLDQRRAPFRADFFRSDGFYLVSGGLGQIGRLLSARLHDEFGLHLLLLGRTPPDAEQQHFLSAHPRLAFAKADVADGGALQRAVAAHETDSGRPLVGILHLAGVGNWESHQRSLARHRLAELSADDLAEQFHAKVEGTRQLYELVRRRPGAQFLAASSVLGLFGGSSFSAYSAANAFLHTFCRARQQAGDAGVHCFHWAPWLNFGMSRGQEPALAAAQGFLTLTPEEGWRAFLVGLTRGQHDLVIGLDPAHPRSGLAKKQITLCYTAGDAAAAERDLAAAVGRLLPVPGQPCPVSLKHVSAIPATLGQLLADGAEAAALPPAMRATELQLQQILQSALSLTTMNPDDNFFELGAHSLLLARLETEIRSRVSPKVALLDLFRFPTLRSLARFIVTSEAPPAAPAPSARPERAPGREALRQSRERHRNRPA